MGARTGLIAILASALVACSGDDPTGPRATTIQVNLEQIVLQQLDSVQIIPSVLDASGTLLSGIPVTFESSNSDMIVVSRVGVVRSVGPAGSANVTVKGAGLSRTVAVTVTAVAVRLSVAPNPAVLAQKTTLQLDAKVIDRAGTPIVQQIQFVVSDTSVIDVSSTGLVTSHGPAKAVSVTVTSGDFAVLVPLTVTQVPTKLDLQPSDATVAQGRTLRLSPRVLDAVDVSIPGIVFTFTSVTPALVTVAADGLVTSVGPLGPAKVRVVAVGTGLSVDFAMTVAAFASPRGDSIQLLGGPLRYAVAFASTEKLLAGSYGGEAYLFDLRTGTGSPIGGDPSFGVAIARGRNKAYFTGGGGLQELDLANRSSRVVPISGEVFDVVVSRDERSAYVGGDAGITVVDLQTFTIARLIAGAARGLHLTLSPTQQTLFSSSGGLVQQVNLTTGAVSPVAMTAGAQATAISSDGRTLYGVVEGGPLSALDLPSGVVRTIFLSGCPGWGMAISPDDRVLVVSCPNSGRLVSVDARTLAIIHTFEGISEGRRVAFSADGATAAVGFAGGVAIIR